MTLPKLFIKNSKRLNNLFLAIVLLLGTLEPFVFAPQAYAVATTAYLRLDRLSASTSIALTGTVCEKPSANNAGQSQVKVTFPSSFTVSSTQTNWTVSTTNLPTGAVAWPNIQAPSAGASISGQLVTFIGNSLLLNTATYCFNFSGGTAGQSNLGSTTGNVTGTIVTVLPNLTTVDNIGYAESMVTSGQDLIVVTGTVPATLSFSLSAFSATFSTNIPTTGAPATTPVITGTVSTNANNGYYVWVKNTNANSALVSPTVSDGICLGGNYSTCTGAAYQTTSANVHSLSGAAGYGLSVVTGTGSPTIATEYQGSATSFGSLDSTKFEQIASNTAPVSGNTFTMTFGAEATATNKAATDYTDTVTVTAAGSF